MDSHPLPGSPWGRPSVRVCVLISCHKGEGAPTPWPHCNLISFLETVSSEAPGLSASAYELLGKPSSAHNMSLGRKVPGRGRGDTGSPNMVWETPTCLGQDGERWAQQVLPGEADRLKLVDGDS